MTQVENVVLVTVDSLRSDAIGYGAADSDTPVIDDVADGGATFEHAFANGNWTPFSFPSILSSSPVFASDGDIGVRSTETIAETLQAEGIHTAGFNAANGFLTEHWGYDSGFDEFEANVSTSRLKPYSQYLAAHPTVQGWLQLASSPFRRAVNRLHPGKDHSQPIANTSKLREVEQRAVSFIEDAGDDPFFLWIHYMDTHTPYVPAPRHLREVSSDRVGTPRMFKAHARTGLGLEVGPSLLADLRTLYDATVRQVDASVGRVRETLEATGVADETALFVAGDHGEEFQEHGHLAHYPKLYDELVHVPFVVDVPGAPARDVDGHVGLDAIPPTICDLLGVASPTSWRGRSLANVLRDGEPAPDDPVVSVAVRGESVTQQPIPRQLSDGELLVSARTRDWTYIRHTESGHEELYHRPSDPTQQVDVLAGAADDAERDGGPPDGTGDPLAVPADGGAGPADEQAPLDELRTVVQSHAASLDDTGGDEDTGAVDDELATRLSALGYR
ncbi:MAG: sulfatase [Halobacteriaceae archaeon]